MPHKSPSFSLRALQRWLVVLVAAAAFVSAGAYASQTGISEWGHDATRDKHLLYAPQGEPTLRPASAETKARPADPDSPAADPVLVAATAAALPSHQAVLADVLPEIVGRSTFSSPSIRAPPRVASLALTQTWLTVIHGRLRQSHAARTPSFVS